MNTARIGSRARNERRRQAREWFVIRQPGQSLPPTLIGKWKKWSADARNLAEYQQYARLDSMLRALPPRPLPSNAELREDTSGEDTGVVTLARLKDVLWASRSRRIAFVLTTCAALVAIGVTLVSPRIPLLLRTASLRPHLYRTDPGGHLNITLEDHSAITLGGSTRLTVLASKESRHVVLNEGEAFFEITHNPQLPFQVDVGAARITDRGTTFNIRRYSDQQVVVTVAEGAVDVAARHPEDPNDTSVGAHSGSVARRRSVTVTKGEAVISDARGEVTAAYAVDLPAATSWLHGLRVYQGAPLAKVIEDVQLYSPRHIEFDPPLATFLFTGYLDQNKPEEWLRGLPQILPVEIDDSNPSRLVIRCRISDCRRPYVSPTDQNPPSQGGPDDASPRR
jgi:transmembrane sensor